jgi:hypothetical protein
MLHLRRRFRAAFLVCLILGASAFASACDETAAEITPKDISPPPTAERISPTTTIATTTTLAPTTTIVVVRPVFRAPTTVYRAPTPAPAPSCPNGTYTNSSGNTVCSPYSSPSGPPAGASAKCNDGTYSFSEHRQGTCSGHGGVAEWY